MKTWLLLILSSVSAVAAGYTLPYLPPPVVDNYPTNFGPITVWFDSSRNAGLQTGGTLSQWTDLSGNGNNATQSTANKKPLVVMRSNNGWPAIRGDGVNDELSCSTGVVPTNFFSLFLVLKQVSAGGGTYTQRAIGNVDGPGTAGFCLLSGPQSGQDYVVLRSAGGPDITLSGTITNGAWYYYSIVMGTNTEVWVNGTSRGTSTRANVASAGKPLQLFCDGNSQFFGNVDIAMVLCYPTNLSTANRQSIEAWITNRYSFP